MFADAYSKKRVLLTGHTGFKGGWLTVWLEQLGAEVFGFALDPKTEPNLCDLIQVSNLVVQDNRSDLDDLAALSSYIAEVQPDFIFHLAAQPLVRESYHTPIDTFRTNILGTAHVLEAARKLTKPCALIAITTDKCYLNREWLNGYREEDPLGGHDPYSASKAGAEIVISSYRDSFFSGPNSPITLASARAGNVIGGGDFSPDRIIPDCLRSLARQEPIAVRNKTATRPWQHVLEPLSGYLWLGALLANPHLRNGQPREAFASPFNFGPPLSSNQTVATLVQELLKSFPLATWIDASSPNQPHEAGKLNLAIDKAFHLLSWAPVWDFQRTVRETADWHLAFERGDLPLDITRRQIENYTTDATQLALPWATTSSP